MPTIMVPDEAELVKRITDVLLVLNRPALRKERWGKSSIEPNGRAWIPVTQLRDRAEMIARLIVFMPPA